MYITRQFSSTQRKPKLAGIPHRTRLDQSPKWSNSFITSSHLLPEDGLGLTTETLLFPVVTSSALSVATLLGLLVLRYLVQLVHLALLAESATLFWYIHLKIPHKKNHINIFQLPI